MDAIFSRMIHFFHPSLDVPEEEERHKEAARERQEKADELREKLKTDPSINEKIDGITSQLMSGVESKR